MLTLYIVLTCVNIHYENLMKDDMRGCAPLTLYVTDRLSNYTRFFPGYCMKIYVALHIGQQWFESNQLYEYTSLSCAKNDIFWLRTGKTGKLTENSSVINEKA